MSALSTVLVTLLIAHQVGDHWVQTQNQADRKPLPGWDGRIACATHVLTYTITALAALTVVAWQTGMPQHPAHLITGLGLSAGTHYLADRRTPLVVMCRWLGKSPVWLTQHGGYYAMDQSWHHGWLLIAALLIV
jgi:hypothetical protein